MPDSSITKKALAQSLKDLMEAHPFHKISVADICEGCGMSRKSFYYHFQDKFDLVQWIFNVEFVQSLEGTDMGNSWELLSKLCNYFYKERSFYRCALQIEGQNSFRDYFCEIITPIIRNTAADLLDGSEDLSFYLTFFTDAFLVSILRWLSSPSPEPPEQYLAHIRTTILQGARNVISLLGGPSAREA